MALALVALAALSTLSVAWTIGSDSAALRWGLVIGGYAAVLIASATLTDVTGPWPVAAGVAGLALLEAVIGLRAVSLHSLPDAERLAGEWRPGGTFEYPPALALLEVATLPVLGYALDRGRAPVAGTAAAAATLAGAVLGLAGSRLGLALAAAVLLALAVRARPRSRSRAAAAATAGFVAIGAIVGPLALGGSVAPAAPGAGSNGAIELGAVALAAAVSWPAIRGLNLPKLGGAIAAALCVGAIALAVVVSVGRADGGHTRLEIAAIRRSDVLHGRAAEWSAAFETWLDRPALGAGADAYYVASVGHQTGAGSRFAHDLPLELAAELGVLGLLLGLAIYASAAWSIATTPRTAGAWLLAPLVVAFLISNLLDWTWHLAGLASLWSAASGALQPARH